MKICFKCKIEKDDGCFYRNKNTKDGLHSSCKPCGKIKIIPSKERKEKKCPKCDIIKDKLQFNKNVANFDGLQSYCKSCASLIEKNYRKTPESRQAEENYRNSPNYLAYEERRRNSPGYKLYQAQYDKENKERRKGVYLLSRYGISELDFKNMLQKQNHCCATCKTDKPGSNGTWHVDHDHKCCPGKKSCGKCVRGLLCSNCNLGLGNFKDSPQTLHAAINYLTQPELFTEGLGI